MREILFRAKRIDNGEWVQGHFVKIWDKYKIVFAEYSYDIDFSTLSQYIGLKDKNGKKIFEGDIVENNECIGVVEYSEEDAMYTVLFDETLYDFSWVSAKMCEVIDNIHDNPELLEVKK